LIGFVTNFLYGSIMKLKKTSNAIFKSLAHKYGCGSV